MNSERIEKLLGWFSTGVISFSLGSFFVVWGWLLPFLSGQPAMYKSTAVDSHIAFGVGLLLIVVGLFLVLGAIIGKLRSSD